MATRRQKKTSAPEFELGATPTPQNTETAPERTETALKTIPASEPATVEPKPDPNAIMFDEYGIDGQCANIPNILKAILCEMIRGRKNG